MPQRLKMRVKESDWENVIETKERASDDNKRTEYKWIEYDDWRCILNSENHIGQEGKKHGEISMSENCLKENPQNRTYISKEKWWNLTANRVGCSYSWGTKKKTHQKNYHVIIYRRVTGNLRFHDGKVIEVEMPGRDQMKQKYSMQEEKVDI